MKIIKIENDKVTFDNGTTVEDVHNQDCCEHVYADWDQLGDTDILTHNFPEQIDGFIEGVEGSGFRLDGYFIPCYNSQNGYYGSNLELHINYQNKKKVILDISNFVEDQID